MLLIMEATVSTLSHWANFYVIVGSSAGALIGLQFVVMTLIADAQIKAGMGEIRAFGTPTVVHFGAAFLISAVMNAPWPALFHVGICLGAFGAVGFVYSIRVIRHARKADYNPDAEDWFWFTVVPLVAYTALASAALLLSRFPRTCLFVIAATTLVFLFVGIRNSWDTVTYVALERRRSSQDSEPQP